MSIELKIADNWSACQLIERLRNQLRRQYMRDYRSRCGVFLLVYQGRRKDYWRHPENNTRLSFDKLCGFLTKEAESIFRTDSGVDEVEVLGIDLTRRSNPHLRQPVQGETISDL